VFASITSRSDLGGGLLQMELTIPSSTAQSYVRVGQYTRVQANAHSAFFFLAGNPGAPTWTLVLRAQGDVAEYLAQAPLGANVEVSDALSDGFAWDLIAEMNVAVLLVGSGFGAAFSVLHRRLFERQNAKTPRVTRLYVGVAQTSDPPAPGFLKAQQALGVEVILCTLDHAPPNAAFPTLHGAMEQAFVDSIAHSDQTWGAIVVGPPALARDLRVLQASAPCLKHVLTNT
jgi:hypothetical protein